MCEGRIFEDAFYERVLECKRDYHKVFNIFSCGCECPRHIRCHGNLVVDPKTCRCTCPPSSCTSPKVLNHYSCDCQCPNRNCYSGYTLDEDTCQCKCTRTCQDHEELDERLCQCKRKPVTYPPTRPTHPPRPTARSPHCAHLNTEHSCRNHYNWNRVACRLVITKITKLQPNNTTPLHGKYYALTSNIRIETCLKCLDVGQLLKMDNFENWPLYIYIIATL